MPAEAPAELPPVTFGDSGIRVPVGTAHGVGIIPADGATGQVLQAYFVWDE